MDELKRKKIIISVLVAAIVALSGILIAGLMLNPKTPEVTPTAANSESDRIDNDALDALLAAQPLYVNGVKYYYASVSPQLEYDAMGATVFNNSDLEIKSFTLAFCAFDAKDKPIQIEQPDETNKAAYIRLISHDLSATDKGAITPGESFDNVIFYVKNEPQIVTIKACVKSFVSTDDVTWNNPYYETFKTNYAGKPLSIETETTTETAS